MGDVAQEFVEGVQHHVVAVVNGRPVAQQTALVVHDAAL